MVHPKIAEHIPLNMAQLKEELKEIKKRDGELSFRGQKTEEYLDQLEILKSKDAKDLFADIKKLDVPRLKDEHIHKIIDILPVNINELKMTMQGYALTISNENLAKIQKAVDEYLPKKSKEKAPAAE
jgi:DNA-directed RNA polymerase subunit F